MMATVGLRESQKSGRGGGLGDDGVVKVSHSPRILRNTLRPIFPAVDPVHFPLPCDSITYVIHQYCESYGAQVYTQMVQEQMSNMVTCLAFLPSFLRFDAAALGNEGTVSLAAPFDFLCFLPLCRF